MLKAIVFDLYETLVTQSGIDVPRARFRSAVSVRRIVLRGASGKTRSSGVPRPLHGWVYNRQKLYINHGELVSVGDRCGDFGSARHTDQDRRSQSGGARRGELSQLHETHRPFRTENRSVVTCGLAVFGELLGYHRGVDRCALQHRYGDVGNRAAPVGLEHIVPRGR